MTEAPAQSSTAAADLVDSSSETVYSSADEITIKLKYLNDNLKIVKARPTEPIGDFKKYDTKRILLKMTNHFFLLLVFFVDGILMKNLMHENW